MKNQRGITLVSLVITIIILIILAAVGINFAIGENGIITKAREAKKMQVIATAKEQIGLEILEAQIEAMENNEELEQTEVETIVAKYGVLQADGDTIILNDTEYEVSLREIYNEMAEEEGDAATELAQLKALLAQTTVTEDKILKDYKAYKDGQLITGTMVNNSGKTVTASSVTADDTNTYLTIPEAGYYDTNSKISIATSSLNSDFVLLDSKNNNNSDSASISNTYTAKKKGKIIISAGGGVASSSSGGVYTTVKLNGTNVSASYNNKGTTGTLATYILDINIGDTIYVVVSISASPVHQIAYSIVGETGAI